MHLSPGIHQIPEDDYHKLTAFSNSDLKLIARSPAHYYAAKLDPNRVEKEPTPALIAGRILHTAILEPDQFDRKFTVVPADAPKKPSITQRNAKNPSEDSIRAILYWDEFEAQNEGKTIIKNEDQEQFKKIADAVRSHPELRGFMAGAAMEQTFIAQDPETGVYVRCRTDFVNNLAGYCLGADLKSAEDARADAFGRSSYKYGYFHQDAFYRDVIEWSGWGKLDLFLFVAFEKEAPFAVKLFQSTPAAIERARATYRRSLNIAAECLSKDYWPAYDTDIETLDYPAWAKD